MILRKRNLLFEQLIQIIIKVFWNQTYLTQIKRRRLGFWRYNIYKLQHKRVSFGTPLMVYRIKNLVESSHQLDFPKELDDLVLG
jgi:hypothetical protein